VDGRIYPWGNRADPNRANYDDAGIGGTSAVGCFPSDASYAYSVEDLSGNVWEWTRSLRTDDYSVEAKRMLKGAPSEVEIPRVVRGGAFSGVPRRVRAAFRSGGGPVDRGRSVGFRVVVSPFTSDL
jgi:formylglycine-generating enzyme required for sulfatase activity